jgi:hypothetical protein
MMKRFLTTTAIALLIGAAPALAVDDSSKIDDQAPPEASQSQSDDSSALPSDPGMTPEATEPSQPQAELGEGQSGQLPTQPGVSPDVAKEAVIPDEGERDTSGGAMDRSSAPPESGAATAGTGGTSDAQSPDISSGEDKSLEKGPSAAEQSPSSGSDYSKE